MAQVPEGLASLALRQAGLVSVAQAEEAGLDRHARRALVTSGEWARLAPGVYDVGARPALDEWTLRRERLVWRAVLWGGPGAVLLGAAALTLRGVEGIPPRFTVDVMFPGGARTRCPAGIRLRRVRLSEQLRIDGHQVSGAGDAIRLHGRSVSDDDAIAVVDSALRRNVLTGPEHPGLVHCGTDRAWLERIWPLVDRRAESVWETRARLLATRAGMPPDELQVPVRLGESIVARGDLGWRTAAGLLVLEVDGESVHGAPDAVFRDRVRQNRMILAPGVRVLRVTPRDLRDRPAEFLVTLARALGRRSEAVPAAG